METRLAPQPVRKMIRSQSPKILAVVLFLAGFNGFSQTAAGQGISGFSYQTVFNQNGIETVLSGINDSGKIVGFYVDSTFTNHGFSYAGNTFTPIDFPGTANGTTARGINNIGQVVGDYVQLNVGYTGFLENVGYTSISVGALPQTMLQGINNSGVIVGLNGASSFGQGSIQSQGFVLSGGSPTPIIYPSAIYTAPYGINDSGTIVGAYLMSGASVYQGFLDSGGHYTTINLNIPSSLGTFPLGINNAGDIVGTYVDSAHGAHGFLLSKGVLKTIDIPGAQYTICTAINNLGQIVGFYSDHGDSAPNAYNFPSYAYTYGSSGAIGFLASPLALLDPVPDLLKGPAITTDPSLLSSSGSSVVGVAADGVTQVVIRIPAVSAGDQITVTLFDDQGLSGSNINPAQDGGLGVPGGTAFSQSQITLTAQSTSSGPMAFGIYQAPLDFSRTTPAGSHLAVCNGVTDIDDNLACRSVSIQYQDVTASGPLITAPIIIVRPPVVLIHGLWGTKEDTWNNFSPLYSTAGSDSRFHVAFATYSYPVGYLIESSVPSYSGFPLGLAGLLNPARANSLGFDFNAPWILEQVDLAIRDVKMSKNPLAIPVAAVQADVVGHSMGGLMTRNLVFQPTFLSDSNYGQGLVHKVITVDTPHLGSPLASDLLAQENSCVRDLLAIAGNPSFSIVVDTDGLVHSGAVGDMQGDGTGAVLSPPLARLAQPGPRTLPVAMIAGVAGNSNYASLAGLNSVTSLGNDLLNFCGDFGTHDELAILLTPTGWPSGVFAGQPSDTVVSLSSQTNNLSIPAPSLFTGYIHSPGIGKMGFSPPTVVDAGAVPTRVIGLLNTPVNQPVFNLLNP